MYSKRFNRNVVLTRHATKRMVERGISESELLDVLDMGEIRYADESHLWAYKEFPQRNDNFICAVVVLEDVVVIKTVMHHFEILDVRVKESP